MATPGTSALRSHLRAAVFAVEATTGDRDQPGTLSALTLPRRGSVGRLRRTPMLKSNSYTYAKHDFILSMLMGYGKNRR